MGHFDHCDLLFPYWLHWYSKMYFSPIPCNPPTTPKRKSKEEEKDDNPTIPDCGLFCLFPWKQCCLFSSAQVNIVFCRILHWSATSYLFGCSYNIFPFLPVYLILLGFENLWCFSHSLVFPAERVGVEVVECACVIELPELKVLFVFLFNL